MNVVWSNLKYQNSDWYYPSKYSVYVRAISESKLGSDSVAESHGSNVGAIFADVKLIDQLFHKLDLGVRKLHDVYKNVN